jgi:hypothetical protein
MLRVRDCMSFLYQHHGIGASIETPRETVRSVVGLPGGVESCKLIHGFFSCREKFQLGTIQEDITCTTPECSPLESALGAPAPEPAAAPTKPVPSPSPVPEKPAAVPAPTVEADAPIVEAAVPIVEAVETAAEAAGRQADTLIDNLEARDAGAMASMSMVLASVAAILLL